MASAAAPAGKLPRVRVLIVEDDPLLGDGLASGLRSLGFAVDWLTDGAAADRALGETPFDAILLDLGLPGGDGTTYELSVERAASRDAATTVRVDDAGGGAAVEDGAVVLPLRRDGATHRVAITLGADVGPRYAPRVEG